MSKVPDGFQPETIVDQPVPLLNGAWTDANGNNSNGALGGLVITPPDIPDVVIPKGVIASEIISSSLNKWEQLK